MGRRFLEAEICGDGSDNTEGNRKIPLSIVKRINLVILRGVVQSLIYRIELAGEIAGLQTVIPCENERRRGYWQQFIMTLVGCRISFLRD